jgi:hypothetical protein
MEDILRPFGQFSRHLVYFVVIWYILWSFGIFCGHLVHFSRFGMFYREKSGNPVFSVLVRCTNKNLATLFLAPHLQARNEHCLSVAEQGDQGVNVMKNIFGVFHQFSSKKFVEFFIKTILLTFFCLNM